MTVPIRSTKGCWTCRVRRKKCDERKEICLACETLNITCHGYGPRPDWMDGGAQERAMMKKLAGNVKQAAKRKPFKFVSAAPIVRDVVVKIAPKLVRKLVPHDRSDDEQNGSLVTPTSEDNTPSSSNLHATPHNNGPPSPIPSEDLTSLMHYLDVLFPLQFPFYDPDAFSGGRGWLLGLLNQSKEFYHAALASSLYHRRSLLTEGNCQLYVGMIVQEETHLEACLRLVKEASDKACVRLELGSLFATLQLVFYELLHDNTQAWRAHLRACVYMVQMFHYRNGRYLGLTEEPGEWLEDDRLRDAYAGLRKEHEGSIFFIVGAVTWLDTMHCVTSGLVPSLYTYPMLKIFSDQSKPYRGISGYKDCAMVLFSDIAGLHTHRTQLLQQGSQDLQDFEQAAAVFKCNLQDAYTAQGGYEASDHISQMFVYTASIYVHLIYCGFQGLDQFDPIIAAIIELLQDPSLSQAFANLPILWFIPASIAKPENEAIFRSSIAAISSVGSPFKHRNRFWLIVEDVWIGRRRCPNFAWLDVQTIAAEALLF